jgi:hypothetical protein
MTRTIRFRRLSFACRFSAHRSGFESSRASAQAVAAQPPPVLGIPKGYNPLTLAFVLEAFAYWARVDPRRADAYRARAAKCVASLGVCEVAGTAASAGAIPSIGKRGTDTSLPATPTIVATGIVTNSLFAAYRLLQLEDAFEMCKSAACFVLEDLPRTAVEDGTFCWGYFPADTQRVLNATMKGARLCAQVYSVTGDHSYLEQAMQTAAYVARHQREDGSWPNAVGDARQWRTTSIRPTSSMPSIVTGIARATTAFGT